MLTDYWSPLGPRALLITGILFLSLDIVGFSLNRRFIKSTTEYRLAFWLYGLSLIVFLIFLLHFRFRTAPTLIYLTLGLATLVALPEYLQYQGFKSLILFLRQNIFLVFVLLSLAPALWIKSSLPPYLTDEVRYHFISPFTLLSESSWSFGTASDLYTYLPKLIDTAFRIILSISKSFAPGRILHFLVYFSAIASAYAILKKHYSLLAAMTWVLFAVFLMPDLLVIATSGYTDYSLAALLVLGVLSLIDSLMSKKLTLFISAAAFFGMAAGIKYTALATTGIFGLLALVWFLTERRPHFHIVVDRSLILKIVVIFLISGGFWYVNNYIFTGNPVYPFFFPCKLSECLSTESFFTGWTIPVTWTNLSVIYQQITVKPLVGVLVFLGIVIALLKKPTAPSRKVVLFLFAGVVLELFILSFYSGFLQRYFLYLQLIALLFIVAATSVSRVYTRIAFIAAIVVMISSLQIHYHPWRNFSMSELAYARQKTNIYNWISDRHPFNRDIITFCADRGPQTLYILDQKIWHTPTNEQFMHIFNINCTYAGMESIVSIEAVKGKLIWIASSQPCQNNLLGTDQDTLVNKLVCLSQPEGRNLYKLDLR